ncbi:shikimate dehydrogenase [Enterobacteriaceae endosymbiont of Plateumaris rustica]|uniref:shikimate dehydrogenase n=1 Tax=Enterobacteriaceae endosymbiont of Plateumaris rustica TaxID=2675796 RepID=UPI001448B7C8|nr:shikimate dehydrogenase [Enterobacteriaceae endosymbiont of Plateumaris rustica]QJC29101.1 shikimate dehydrogenase [Enterobacteriaceae endosymbiont of Plateumaris rustica]
MKIFAIFGNPIKHSKSPIIHKLFANQLNIIQQYKKIYVPIDKFNNIINNFFKNGGYGANITIPFKKKAYNICDFLTDRGIKSGVVNTLKIIKNNKILGDNTDGIGLLKDLQKIKFIHKNSNILLLGAGGAAKGIIYSIINFGCKITIVNRTYKNSYNLLKFFNNKKNISIIKIEDIDNIINNKKINYDLIINATSSSIKGEVPKISSKIIHSNIFCYDLFYSINITPFLEWCLYHGAKKISDGIGMLIEQAAYSFFLWHGVMPNTELILKQFKKKYFF